MIIAKYYYAGGCARYMLAYTTEGVKQAIKEALDDFTKVKGDVKDLKLLELCNRLFSLFAKKRTDIVSEYARSEIQKALESDWLKKVAQTPGLTSATKGLLFQEWVVKLIETGTPEDFEKRIVKKMTLPDFGIVDRKPFTNI